MVECSFVTEFEDHIFVAMDAEVILFLHDLILSYIKEKDKGQQVQKLNFCMFSTSVTRPSFIQLVCLICTFLKNKIRIIFFGNLSSKTILLVEKQSHQRHLFSYKCDTLLATTIPILLMYLIISGTKAPYGTSSKSPRTPESERKRITDPTTALKEDWRVFECNTWHLEPTVRCV